MDQIRKITSLSSKILIIVDNVCKGYSFIVSLTIDTLILIATFLPHTAGLQQANYLYHRGCLWLVYHKPCSWLVGFDPKHCWHCVRKKLIPQRSVAVEIGCHVVRL